MKQLQSLATPNGFVPAASSYSGDMHDDRERGHGPLVKADAALPGSGGWLRRLGRVGPLAVAAAVMPGVGAFFLYGRLGAIGPWLRDHPQSGPLICAAVFGVAGGVALVPTYALSALCGWSFGFGVGLIAALGGFLMASIIGYWLGRAIDGGRVAVALAERPKAMAVQNALAGRGVGKLLLVITFLRLAPIAPFSLTNLVLAAAQVRLLPFALGTVLGMAPRTAVVVYAASHLSTVDAPMAQSPWWYVTGALATIAAIAVISWVGKAALRRVTTSATG